MAVEVQVEELSQISRKLSVTVPADDVKAARQAAVQKVQKNAKVKGFRPGKVPPAMVEKLYGRDVILEAMESLVQESYPKALEEAGVHPLAQPQVEPAMIGEDDSFSYTATVEVRPEVTVDAKNYTGLKLEHDEVTIPEGERDAQIERMRDAMTTLAPAGDDAAVAEGMVAHIKFSGQVDGKSFEGSEADDFPVDIGAGSMLPSFEEQLVGMKAGETKEISFEYPEEYFNVSLSGGKAVFQVTVKEVKNKVKPELDDDFAKSVGEYENFAALQSAITEQMQKARDHDIKSQLGEQIITSLIESTPFEVPETMVGWELSSMYQNLEQRAKAEGQDMKAMGITPESFMEQYRDAAVERIRGYLLLDAIAKAESIEASEDDVDARLQEIADGSGENLPRVRLYYEQNNLIPSLEAELIHQKCVDFVIEKSKIKVKKAKKSKK